MLKIAPLFQSEFHRGTKMNSSLVLVMLSNFVLILMMLNGMANGDVGPIINGLFKHIDDRLELAPKVAKYKVDGIEADKPKINDAERENAVIANVLGLAKDMGITDMGQMEYIEAFFVDQMEANKIYQTELKEQKEELERVTKIETMEQFETEVRKKIDEINEAMVEGLANFLNHPDTEGKCQKMVFEKTKRGLTAYQEMAQKGDYTSPVPFARVHALVRALSHLCTNLAGGKPAVHEHEGRSSVGVGHGKGANKGESVHGQRGNKEH